MSRRAKESDASLAFSTTTIDDDDDEFFWIFSSSVVCVLDLFLCVLVDLFLFLCSKEQYYSSSVSSEAVCFIIHFSRKFSLRKKKKIKKEKRGTKKDQNVVFFTSPFCFFFSLSLLQKKKILSFFDRLCPTFLCVALRLHQRKERSLKKRLERPFDARTHKTNARKRETHTHTHTHTHTEREREEHGQTQVESAASEKSPA